MGPKLQLQQIDWWRSTLFVRLRRVQRRLGLEGALARDALDKVDRLFRKTPFPGYTVVLESSPGLCRGTSTASAWNTLNSGTFYLDIEHAITAKSNGRDRETHRFNFAHHIAHSWIPKRAYGEGYLPLTWEMAPLIDTIWFNEGFGRYVAIASLAEACPRRRRALPPGKTGSVAGHPDAAPRSSNACPCPIFRAKAPFYTQLIFESDKTSLPVAR